MPLAGFLHHLTRAERTSSEREESTATVSDREIEVAPSETVSHATYVPADR
jgi:hypothetical protein